MRIELSTEHAEIRKLLTHDLVYRRIASDLTPEREEIPEVLPEQFQYVAAKDDHGIAAVFVLCPTLPAYTVDLHFAFHPRAWGRSAGIAQRFVNWLWKETAVLTAIGTIPAYNVLALKLAQTVGFRQFWREMHAVTKKGKSFDLIHTRIERPA